MTPIVKSLTIGSASGKREQDTHQGGQMVNPCGRAGNTPPGERRATAAHPAEILRHWRQRSGREPQTGGFLRSVLTADNYTLCENRMISYHMMY